MIPLRYRLTTHAGPIDDVAACRFGTEERHAADHPARLPAHRPELTGRFLDVPDDAPGHWSPPNRPTTATASSSGPEPV